MTKIKPFKAVIYNQGKIKNLSQVVCPPYDVLSPAQQKYYHELNPHNFLNILLPKDTPDKYERAGQYFQNWQKEQILINDKSPAVYFYSQQYNLKGEKKTRFGFMALLRLGDRKSGVFGHENTRLAAKEDRAKLLRQVKANLSPIFVIFPDRKRIISRIREKYINSGNLFMEATDNEKTVHQVWRIDSENIISMIQESMLQENMFIADGHHRYEVACAYRDEMEEKLGVVSGEESFNYILAYFTNIDTRGLTILPIHRLVKLKAKLDGQKFRSELSGNFDVEEIKDKTKFFFLMNKAGEAEHIIGMYANKRYWMLRLKNIKILDKIIVDKPKEYRLLDVSILNYMILKQILGLDLDDKESIIFNHNADELIEQVDQDSGYVAFFLNSTKVSQIMAIALNGEKMPPKTTFFYPKVRSGLVVNKLE
ncbi:MAG: DUF1015 domain-containing protein [Candidatus Omnitrophota bacterium]